MFSDKFNYPMFCNALNTNTKQLGDSLNSDINRLNSALASPLLIINHSSSAFVVTN
ncbi:MAG: hypothetical protein ACK5L5_06370 [Bacteroidales bacterium]